MESAAGKEYGSWTLKRLKEELRQRGARLAGKKAALVERSVDDNTIQVALHTNLCTQRGTVLCIGRHSNYILGSYLTYDVLTITYYCDARPIYVSTYLYVKYNLIILNTGWSPMTETKTLEMSN